MIDYTKYNSEELRDMLDNPQDIETGCEHLCDECLAVEIKAIKQALIEVETQESL